MRNSNLVTVRASAPGKVILFGEHFVVHGSYALSAAIEKRASVTVSESDGAHSTIVSDGVESRLFEHAGRRFSAVEAVVTEIFRRYGKRPILKIDISSDIPPGSGLGSSAAVSVATTAALGRYLGQNLRPREILEIASLGEKIVHGNPSGIDVETSLRGGVLLFSKRTGSASISLKKPIRLLVVFSGKKRKTLNLISKVRSRKERFPSTFSSLSKDSSLEAIQAAKLLKAGNVSALGGLMDSAQMRLSWIGVSNSEIDFLIESILQGDSCYGAKLTGAGGGGSVIALPKAGLENSILRRILNEYSFSFLSTIPREGLRFD